MGILYGSLYRLVVIGFDYPAVHNDRRLLPSQSHHLHDRLCYPPSKISSRGDGLSSSSRTHVRLRFFIISLKTSYSGVTEVNGCREGPLLTIVCLEPFSIPSSVLSLHISRKLRRKNMHRCYICDDGGRQLFYD